MSVELPFAPVDAIIRQNAGELRVSAGAAEELARRIQDHGASLAVTAATEATTDGRKTLMPADFGIEQVPEKDGLELPVAPVDRIARLDIDDDYRVAMDARVALASLLETYADERPPRPPRWLVTLTAGRSRQLTSRRTSPSST